MKKYTILLMLCLAFSYVKAQTMLVNSNVISVHEDVTFPLWLDSMSTIEIGTQVVSISALEFNIVPANNGNSLVFSQTKTITSQETVPNGMTWKITAVLLDSTAINNSSSSGGGQVIVSGSGGNMAVALSEESASTMNMGDALVYCDSLQEGGYDNWVVPTLEELMFVASGGGVVPGVRTSNYLWSGSVATGYGYYFNSIRLSDGMLESLMGYDPRAIRCVRHESISVSGSGSSSGGSGSSSGGGGGGNIAVALSEEIQNITMGDAMLYCDSLQEGGYDNWVIPTLEEVVFVASGGGEVPGARTGNLLWTSCVEIADNGIARNSLISVVGLPWLNETNGTPIYNVRCVRHESISVSGSGGSNTPSTLGSGMPTMLSNESVPMMWGDAVLYCDSLSESGYSDWIMPSFDQITYAMSGGCIMTDARTANKLWTRTIDYGGEYSMLTISLLSDNNDQQLYGDPTYPGYISPCRCVR